MVISAASRVAAKALKIAKAKKHALQQRKYRERKKAKGLSAVANKTIKKTDYFIRKKPLPTTTPGSVFTHGDWVHELPVKKLRHVRHGTDAPPMRAFSPKQDIHKTTYFSKGSVKPVIERKLPVNWARRSDWFGTGRVYSNFVYGPGPSGVPKKILEARKFKEKVKKAWWTEFLKQSRAGKHLGVAGTAGGLGVYAASEKGKK